MRVADFADEYRSMREQGMSHDEIAHTFHIQRESLLRRLFRNRIEYMPESDERVIYDGVEKLIASGRDFTAQDLPNVGTPHCRSSALLRAYRSGRIEIIGGARSLNRYRAVAQKDSVAA